MRIIFLPDTITVVLFFVVWAVIQVGSALVCLNLPDKFFNHKKGIYKSKKFEKNTRFYEKFLLIKKWKGLLPDGGAVYKKKGYAKKRLTNYSKENLNKFLVESCRAELTHLLPICFVWVFLLFTTPQITLIMLSYSLISNLPCLIVQRYNRPRIERILERKYK